MPAGPLNNNRKTTGALGASSVSTGKPKTYGLLLTLVQTKKLGERIPILLYGSGYWKAIINFDALARHGMISPEDLDLFQFADDPGVALKMLTEALQSHMGEASIETPSIAKSVKPE